MTLKKWTLMKRENPQKSEKQGTNEKKNESISNILLVNLLTFFVTALIVLPLFLFLHRVLPFPEWKFHFERILLFLGLFVGFFFLLRKIRKVIWIILGVMLFGLTVGTLFDRYGFEDVFWDYHGFINNLAHNSYTIKDVKLDAPFPRRQTIINAIEFTNKDVRKFSHKAVQKNFTKYQHAQYKDYVQYLAVFKEINNNWVYIKDPTSREYIAKARESIDILSGDCDDYSVLMAACIKSIGGVVRLVRTSNHIYPELQFKTKADLDNVIYLIRKKLFKKETQKKTFYYHTDSKGVYWLNLDYTANYPGGPFMPEDPIAFLIP